MANCHKCGRGKIKKRKNGTKKCRSCGFLPGFSPQDIEKEIARSAPSQRRDLPAAACAAVAHCVSNIEREGGESEIGRIAPLADEELTINGHKPQNPFGSCFDSAAHLLAQNYNSGVENIKMCHGIGIANKPGEIGKRIAHAWVEFDHHEGKAAIDPIWLLAQPAEIYRRNLKAEMVIEYTKEEFIRLWKERNYPGPYDDRIKSFTRKEVA